MTKKKPVEQHGKTGRPTKRTATTEASILATLKAGVPLSIAAPACGVSRETVHTWQKQDPAFRAACEKTIAEANASYIVRLAKQSAGGNVVATIFFLKARCPEFREPKDQPAPVNVGAINDSAAMSRMLLALAQQVADGKIPASVLRDMADAAEKTSSVLERADLEDRVKKLESKQ